MLGCERRVLRLSHHAGISNPMDVFVVRKLGLPGHPELAMGAIGSGGVQVMNKDVAETASSFRAPRGFVSQRQPGHLEHARSRYAGDRRAPAGQHSARP